MALQIAKRRPDPFDGSSSARLSRMGLLTGTGDVDEAAMRVFIHIFAASFFDDLCDTYEALEAVTRITAAFCELEERKDPQRIFFCCSPSSMTPCESLCLIRSGGWQGIPRHWRNSRWGLPHICRS